MIEELESLILVEDYVGIQEIINLIELDPKAGFTFIAPYQVIKLRLQVANQQYEKAIEFYNEYLNETDNLEDSYQLQAKIQLFISVVALSKLEFATQLMDEIKNEHNESLENMANIDVLLKNQALVSLLIQKGEFIKAKEICMENYHFAVHLENNKWQAITSNKLGVIYDYLGRLHKATKYFELAIDSIGPDADKLRPNQLTKLYNNLVGIYSRRGYIEKSLAYLNIMERMVEDQKNYSMMGQVHIYKGMMQYAKGNLDKALLEFGEAKDVLEENGSKYDLFFIYGTYFEYFIDLHFKDEAKYYLHMIEDVLTHEEGSFYLSYLHLYRGLLLKLSPSTKDRGQAMTIFQSIFEGPLIDYEITVRAGLNYIELQINDLMRYESDEIKLEFLSILDKLETLAVHEEIGELLAQTLLLRAKLAFIEQNNEAYLANISKATSICKDLGYDYLLAQIKMEEEFIAENEILLDTLPGIERGKMLYKRLEEEIKLASSSKPKVIRIDS